MSRCMWTLNDKAKDADIPFYELFGEEGKPQDYWSLDEPLVFHKTQSRSPLRVVVRVPAARFHCQALPFRAVVSEVNNCRHVYDLIKKMYESKFTAQEALLIQEDQPHENPPHEGDPYMYPRLENLFDQGLRLVPDECTTSIAVLELDYGS